jgi:hypothetical protein
MKRIADERARIDGYRFSIGPSDFFNDRQYQPDWEWLILSYLAGILETTGRPAPVFGEKLLPPEPDFQTCSASGAPFRRIEVTEVMRPDRRRNQEHSDRAKSQQLLYDAPDPHPTPWSSFHEVLRSKLDKPYALGTWLLIYHNMPSSEFEDFALWDERVLNTLRTWTTDSTSTCDITRSCYDSIYVVDAGGKGAVRLHPHWDVIKKPPCLFSE